MLHEWQRVLKPGGLLILELPCMDKIIRYITQCMNEGAGINLAFSWWAFWGDPKYQAPAMCHKWGYTYDSLTKLLTTVGFTNVQIERPRYHFADRDMRVTANKGAL